jgi:hypothetical protein
MGHIADVIITTGNLSLYYGEVLLKGVTPEQFARLAAPKGTPIQSNHPAFVYGHLSYYPKRMLEMLGQPAGVTAHPDPAKWDLLFKAGAELRDDPQGTIYPAMPGLTKFYFDGYRAVLATLAATSDADLLKSNPAEGRMKEMFPTVGAVINFLMGGHQMSHFGQVSAWRRMVGLPSAM